MKRNLYVRVFLVLVTCVPPVLLWRRDSRSDCPCWDQQLCEPISIKRTKEVFVYTDSRHGNWRNYRWDKITTISPIHFHDDALMCYAHSRNVSYVYFTSGNRSAFIDPHLRSLWVNETLSTMKENFYDGVTLDFEEWIFDKETNVTAAFIETVKILSEGARRINPNAQLSECIGGFPDGRGHSALGYQHTAQYLDFFYLMDYSMGAYCMNCTTARAGAIVSWIKRGLSDYLKLGIPSSKLLLSLPWFGFDWKCLRYDKKNHTCWITQHDDDEVDAKNRLAKNVGMRAIWTELLPKSFTGRLWDETSKSPYFIYKDENGTYHDVRYDDPESLPYRYDLVSEYKLRGTGMWAVDSLDYSNRTMVDAYWEQLPLN